MKRATKGKVLPSKGPAAARPKEASSEEATSGSPDIDAGHHTSSWHEARSHWSSAAASQMHGRHHFRGDCFLQEMAVLTEVSMRGHGQSNGAARLVLMNRITVMVHPPVANNLILKEQHQENNHQDAMKSVHRPAYSFGKSIRGIQCICDLSCSHLSCTHGLYIPGSLQS